MALALAGVISSACTGPQGEPGPDGISDTGCPGPVIEGTCLIGYSNVAATSFVQAALTCATLGGDLCTDSQAFPLTVGISQNQYLSPAIVTVPVWLSGFSDNDALYWTVANAGTGDDHSANSSYGYLCCGGATPVNPRVPGEVVDGVWTTYVHDVADTTFSGAVGICGSLRSDICTDSQTFLLRRAGALSVKTWTAHHADNDLLLYNAINGGTPDNPHPSEKYGFACCGSTRPTTLDCPVAERSGVCAVAIHDVADTDFATAATACAAAGADLCSTAQSAVLRTVGSLSAPVWTNSHSDNDLLNVASGVGAVPDNPDLSATYGYACCLN
jgi:hypothetical protein